MNRIALGQLNASDKVDDNLAKIASFAAAAAAENVAALFLPECCALMQSSRDQLRQTAEPLGAGLIQDNLSSIARQHDLYLFAGSIPIQSENPKRVFNCSMVFDQNGVRRSHYHKIHLFDVSLDSGERYQESAYTMPGSEVVNLDCPLGNIGLSVCYDLRFPELYRALVARGAQVLLVPSAFSPTTGPAHWEPLLRARAIENFCYVIAAAQVGAHPSGRKTWGHSLVIDPWGKVVADKGDEQGLLIAEIDLKKVTQSRNQMPSLDHRIL